MMLFDTSEFATCKQRYAISPDIGTDTDQRYTPMPIIHKCVNALTGIGLDPTANAAKTVPALNHITEAQDCFATDWAPLLSEWPTVFMNPPYSNSERFLHRMAQYLRSGECDRAITLTLAGVLANKSTQPLIKELAVAIAHPLGHVNFIGGGDSNDRDVVFILWGNGARANHTRFFDEFNSGLCVKLC